MMYSLQRKSSRYKDGQTEGEVKQGADTKTSTSMEEIIEFVVEELERM